MPSLPAWAHRLLSLRRAGTTTTADASAAGPDGAAAAPTGVPAQPAPSFPPPPALFAAIAATYASATAAGSVCKTETAASIRRDGGWAFVVRSATETLAKKDEAGRAATSASPPRPGRPAAPLPPGAWFNPFLPPDPALVVLQPPAFPATHALVLNKFNLAPHHALIITARFERQEAPLTCGDLAATWAVLDAYPGAGGLAYYNRGPASGASQPHKHLQVVPLPLSGGGGGGEVHGSPSPAARAPFEATVLAATAGSPLYEPVPLRALPFRAFGARLPGGRDPGGSQPASPSALAACVAALAAAAGAHPPGLQDWTPGDSLAAVKAGAGPDGTPTASWNLVFTRRAVMVVPRPLLGDSGGGGGGGGGSGGSGNPNLNGIAYAGSLYVRGPADEEAMAEAGGAMGLLAAGGVEW